MSIYDLQVIFSVRANFGRIPSNRLGTLKQFVNTLCCNHLSTGSHALIPLSGRVSTIYLHSVLIRVGIEQKKDKENICMD